MATAAITSRRTAVLVHLGGVRKHEGEHAHRRSGYEQIGERARLDPEIEKLGEPPHRGGGVRQVVPHCELRAGPEPRGTRPRAA